MALFDRTAKRLARGPAVLFPADPAGVLRDALLCYDPALRVKNGSFVFRNGVHLNGPVPVTPEVARKAGLPDGMTAGYYASIIETGTRGSRPDDEKRQDAERLVRGLATRLSGTVHHERPPMGLDLSASVYSARALPAEQLIGVLQPYVDTGELVLLEEKEVPGAYFLVTEEDPLFFVVYFPPRLSGPGGAWPPPAIGALASGEPSRWDLATRFPVQAAARETCLKVGAAALALAQAVGGVVIDAYGFPVDSPDDMLPR